MLEEYNRKRNFKNTPEPTGNLLDEKNLKIEKEKENNIPRFVIQKHDATRLHYDFRLESKKDKVLISWAVPKGPSLDPKVKRLAILTENHPVDYLLFEGIIPKGNYGAGTVIVWDTGTYCLESINPEKKEDVSDQFEKGKINFILFGQKLKGRFSLIRTSKENQWLLLKPQDNFSPSTNKEGSIQTDITKTNPESVISGLTNNQIKESNTSQEFLKEPKENSKSELQKPSSFPLLPTERRSDEVNDNMYKRSIPGLSQSISDFYSQSKTNLSISSPNNSPVIRSPSLPSSSPTTLDDTNSNNILNNFKPMLATLIENPFNNQDWFFEIKWDGIRAISTLNNSKIIDIKSRNGNKITKRFPELVEALEALANINDLKNMMLDGEIVVLDKKGFPDFQALQKRININITKFIETSLNQFPATYYIFDILYLDGIDLKTLPLIERRKVLETIISKSKNNKKIKVSEFIGGEGKDIFHSIKKMNLEGMVAKHKQSKYYPNTRSREWLKIKNTRTQDCAVIGYTRGEGNRERYFGSLLLAAKVNSMEKINMDKLKFIGHCGSGFDFEQIIEIYEVLEKIKTKTCPIDYIPYVNREPIWVKPVLVVEVKFNGWTYDKIMRSPIFLRCRIDKSSHECILEEGIDISLNNKDNNKNINRISKDKDKKEIKSHNLHIEIKNNNLQHNNITNTSNLIDSQNDLDSRNDINQPDYEQHQSSKSQLTPSFNKYNFSNLDKIYWKESRSHSPITKRDLIGYYDSISSYILPHLKNRPLSLNRYPDGPKGKSFYQKNWQGQKPEYVQSVKIYSESKGEVINYLLCNNKETLLWLANLGCIEIHPWYSRIKDQQISDLKSDRSELKYPDYIVFDLDPYIYSGNEDRYQEPEYNLRAFKSTVEVALCLKDIFDDIKIRSFIKTSGKTGLHILIPIINLYTYEQTKSFAKITGRILNKLLPNKITTNWNTSLRKERVFYDYNQNAIGKTISSVFSARPTDSATVSMPIDWKDLSHILPTDFTILNAPQVLKRKNDPWEDISSHKQDLAKILDKVSNLNM